MSKTILFIDGENFLHKIEDVLKKESKAKGFPETINLDLLWQVTSEGKK